MAFPHRKIIVKLLKTLEKSNQTLVGAEIGIWTGITSSIVLSSFTNIFWHMIDSWELGDCPEEKQVQFKKDRENAYKNVELYKDRYRIYHMTSKDAAKLISDYTLDFVFIDADHSYNAVILDMNLWWPKVKNKGIMAGHDYGSRRCPDVKPAVIKWSNDHKLLLKIEKGWVWYIDKD